MTETIRGGCLCGAVRYEARPGRALHYLCHCRDCQRYGGGHHAGIVVAVGDVAIEGAPQVWTKRADSGREIARHFCGACGGHLFTSPWPDPKRLSIKAGTLDDPAAFAPRHEIWTQGRARWAAPLAGAEQHAQGFSEPIDIGSRSGSGDRG